MKCVYKIVCRDKDITEFYIGSSVDFEKRKTVHKSDSNNLKCGNYCCPLYMFINVNGGIENWDFEVIKEYKFITKEELEMNEQYWMDLLKPNLNFKKAKGIDMERRKNHNKIKANCEHCGKEMLKCSINRHIERKHKNKI